MAEKASDRRGRLLSRFRKNQCEAGLISENGTIICPVCWQSQPFSEMTLEHIVPGAVGGRRTTLTCRTCNNQQGRDLDAHLVKFHEAHDALNGFGGIRSRLFVNGRNIAVSVTASSDPKQVNMHVVDAASHPEHVLGLKNDCQNGEVEQLKLKMQIGYDKNRMQTALLRIGYLAIFHRFGYRYAAAPTAHIIRLRILDPALTTFRLSSFIAGITDWKLPFDRQYFVLSNSLNSMAYFQVMIRCRIHTTLYHGVALPGVGTDSPDFFPAFEAHSSANRRVRITGLTEGDVFE